MPLKRFVANNGGEGDMDGVQLPSGICAVSRSHHIALFKSLEELNNVFGPVRVILYSSNSNKSRLFEVVSESKPDEVWMSGIQFSDGKVVVEANVKEQTILVSDLTSIMNEANKNGMIIRFID